MSPGIDKKVFQITLGAEFSPNNIQYKILTKPQEVKKPKNWHHRLRKKLGLSYKETVVGWEYDIEKSFDVKSVSVVDGKMIIEE